LGIYGAVIANLILLSALFAYQIELSGVIDSEDLKVFGSVFLLVIAMGVLISYLSTLLAVNKFLRMKFDELFY
jgi:cell division transport system permease protein